MPLNIIYSVKGQLNPTLVDQIASMLVEDSHRIKMAIRELIPVVVEKISENYNNSFILNLIMNYDDFNLAAILEQPQDPIIKIIFHQNTGKLICLTSVYTEISHISSRRLLYLISSYTITILGQYAKENKLSYCEISDLLYQQKTLALPLIPQKGIFNFLISGPDKGSLKTNQ